MAAPTRTTTTPARSDGRSGDRVDVQGADQIENRIAETRRLEPREDEIRRRAYGRYLERGRTDGHAEEDWLRAEDELRRGM